MMFEGSYRLSELKVTITTTQLILGFVSTLALVILVTLSILEYRRDRPIIKVTVRGGYGIPPEIAEYVSGGKIVITAINRGRRPVTLTKAGFILPKKCKGSYFIAADSLKIVKLEEGESKDYIIDEDTVKAIYGLIPDKYIAFIVDATGNYHWSHNKLKRLIKLGRIK